MAQGRQLACPCSGGSLYAPKLIFPLSVPYMLQNTENGQYDYQKDGYDASQSGPLVSNLSGILAIIHVVQIMLLKGDSSNFTPAKCIYFSLIVKLNLDSLAWYLGNPVIWPKPFFLHFFLFPTTRAFQYNYISYSISPRCPLFPFPCLCPFCFFSWSVLLLSPAF